MFKCQIAVFLPLRKIGTTVPLSFSVAEFDFDPGLQKGDTIELHKVAFTRTTSNESGEVRVGDAPRFSFYARVKRRKKIVLAAIPKDKFVLAIEVEMADKEQLPEIIKYLKDTFKGAYEELPLSIDSDDIV